MTDSDFILRGDAVSMCREVMLHFSDKLTVIDGLNLLPPQNAIPATEEAAVRFLTESGWMEKHDKQIRADERHDMERWAEDTRNGQIQGMW